MSFITFRRLLLLVACIQVGTLCGAARAVPLTAERTTSASRERHHVNDAEVLQADPSTTEPTHIRPLNDPTTPHPALRGLGPLGGLGGSSEIGDITHDGTSSSVVDALRPLLNLNPRTPEVAGKGHPRQARQNEQDIIMSGTALQEWMDEAVRGIVDSAIELRVDEQGRASFSVLGMGDFGVMVSGDRNEVALVSGADVLFTAHRGPHPLASGYGGAGPDYGPPGLATGSRPIDTRSESPLHQAMELLTEIATHPLSLLIYAIVGAYALLWNILSVQRRTRPQQALTFAHSEPATRMHRSSGRRRFRRSRRN